MSATEVVRVPEQVKEEATVLAALRGTTAGTLIGEAWAEYVSKHREGLARDLEHAAKLLRDGTVQDLAKFANRSVEERAAAAAERARRNSTND